MMESKRARRVVDTIIDTSNLNTHFDRYPSRREGKNTENIFDVMKSVRHGKR